MDKKCVCPWVQRHINGHSEYSVHRAHIERKWSRFSMDFQSSDSEGDERTPRICHNATLFGGRRNTMEVIIKGGTVVTADDTYRADVLCIGETIAAIGEDLEVPAGAEVIDASGALVVVIQTP